MQNTTASQLMFFCSQDIFHFEQQTVMFPLQETDLRGKIKRYIQEELENKFGYNTAITRRIRDQLSDIEFRIKDIPRKAIE